MNFKLLISAILASTIAVVGCESDSTSGGGSGGSAGTGGSAGSGGSGGSGGAVEPKGCDDIPDTSNYIVPDAPPTSDACDMTLNPTGSNDHAQIIDALVNNDLTDKTLCLGVGTWDMGGTVGITADPGLTLKGLGDSPDDVVLDYADENLDCRGSVGINVGVDNVTIENMWVKNTCANSVEQRDVNGSVFRKVRVSWDDRCEGSRARENCGESCNCEGLFAPANCDQACVEDSDCDDGRLACKSDVCVPNAETYCDDPALTCGGEGACIGNMTLNGAYGIYPTDCQNTLVEYCQVQGASDAGIYVGKCTGGLVENNIVYENVAGLEVENCIDVDASNNSAFNNVGGLFALQQDISGDMQANSNIRLFDSESYCNNHDNFAKEGSAVAGIPVGTGILSFAGNGVEIFGNEITDNLTLGVGLASNILNCQIAGSDCPEYRPGYDPYVKNNYIHDNLFTNNGTDPTSLFGTLFKILGFGVPGTPVPDIVWDGYKEAPEDTGLCLGTDAEAAASVLVIGDACKTPIDPALDAYIMCAQDNNSTDQTPYLCEPSPE